MSGSARRARLDVRGRGRFDLAAHAPENFAHCARFIGRRGAVRVDAQNVLLIFVQGFPESARDPCCDVAPFDALRDGDVSNVSARPRNRPPRAVADSAVDIERGAVDRVRGNAPRPRAPVLETHVDGNDDCVGRFRAGRTLAGRGFVDITAVENFSARMHGEQMVSRTIEAIGTNARGAVCLVRDEDRTADVQDVAACRAKYLPHDGGL